MKKALICGVSGQDGAYIAEFLLSKGYEVYGGSRDAQVSQFSNLIKLGIKDKVKCVSVNINDFRSTIQTIIRIQPDEIYNLAGQSSVGLSFEQPMETFESITMGTLNLLEAIRFSGLPIKMYNAGSSECFGDTGLVIAAEDTPFIPRSPYGVAKAASHWAVANYREAYNLFVCTGILFNHESPLRPQRFVTQKIISVACRISLGSKEKLTLGNINIERDWGWAPDYVEAMWLMLQQDSPQDFVIATGETNKLKDFIRVTFELLDMNWEENVLIDKDLFRPTDIKIGRGDPKKAAIILNWRAKHKMIDIVKLMIDYTLKNIII